MKWTDIITVSELEDLAQQYWVDKTCGGAEPKLKDMFIAGFILGCKTMNERAEQKIEFEKLKK